MDAKDLVYVDRAVVLRVEGERSLPRLLQCGTEIVVRMYQVNRSQAARQGLYPSVPTSPPNPRSAPPKTPTLIRFTSYGTVIT